MLHDLPVLVRSEAAGLGFGSAVFPLIPHRSTSVLSDGVYFAVAGNGGLHGRDVRPTAEHLTPAACVRRRMMPVLHANNVRISMLCRRHAFGLGSVSDLPAVIGAGGAPDVIGYIETFWGSSPDTVRRN